MDQPPCLRERHSPAHHSVPTQRPVSPVPSCVSMKSDNSMDQSPYLGEGHSPASKGCPHQRPVSPVPSCVSMKSDSSMVQPLSFKDHAATIESPIQQMRSPSPEVSCVSMKSGWSMDQPPKLGEGHYPTPHRGPIQRPVSPVPSCVSMKSDNSIDQPPKLGDGHSPGGESCPHQRPVSPVPSYVSMKSDNSMVQPPKLEDGHSPDGQSCPHQRPVSPVPSCVSMKSDNSMVQPPKLEDGHSPGGQSFQTDVDSCTSDHDLTMTSPDTSYHESEEEDLTENRSDFTFSEKKMQDKLKSHLRTKLQHVFKAPSNPVLLSDIYTELYITEGDMGEVNNEHEVREIEAASRGDTESTPIKCSDIFKPLPAQCKPIRTVLTKGIAGIGKTVCVQKFALDWAEGTDNQDIKYIFLLSFRELNLLKAKEFSLLGLLKQFVGEFESVPVLEAKQYEVLLIFDGLDECRLPLAFEENEKCKPATAATAASVDVLLTHLIQGHLLPSALIWITSRPAAAGRIRKGCVDRVTAVRGFGDPQKKEYFRKRIRSQTLADKVITHIESLRSLHIMCHIPVFCWISAAVLERLFEEEEVGAIPKNLTQMYTHFLVVQTDTKKKYKERKETDEEMIFKLGKLAFQQLEMGNLIFYEEDLKKCDIDVKEASVYSGVCTQIFREECGLYQGKVFCFVHLSIQEFLAALYVLLSHFYSKESEGLHPGEKNSNLVSLFTAPTLSELQITAVDKALQQPNGSLDLFVRFLLGLCFSAHQPDQTILQVFLPHIRSTSSSNADVIEYIKTRIQINQSPEPSINLFHCLNELNDHSLVEEIQKYQSSRSLSKVTLTPGLWSALVFVLLTSDSSLEVFDLGKYTSRPSDKSLFRMRPVLRESRKAELASCNLTENSCGTLATVISSPNSRLRELDLSDNTIQDTGVALLSRGIKKSSCKLEKLSLSCCGIGRSGCESLLSAILRNPSHLTSIDLSHNRPEHNGMILLSTVLQNQQCCINKLMLINCSISHNSCQLLAMALCSKNSSLRYLDLSGNQIENRGVGKLSQGLKNSNCKLNSLRLGNCSLTEKSCAYLASAASSTFCRLKELTLGSNELHDAGVQHLSDLLRNPHCKLEKLVLSGCSLTEKSCAGLASAASSVSCSLKELNLSDNDLHDAGVQHLSDLLKSPHCKLEKLVVDVRIFTKETPPPASNSCPQSSDAAELHLRDQTQQDPGVELLSVDTPKQRWSCRSCAHITDPAHWTLVAPSISMENGGCVYNMSSPAGSYECSESGLRWVCAGPVVLQYHFSKEELFWAQLQMLQYQPAGPLMDIKLLSGELEEVHLPHSLCLGGSDPAVLEGAVKFLHSDDSDSGVSLETCELSRFHGKLPGQRFSLWQLAVSLGIPVKTHCEVLIYQSCPQPLVLNAFLVPTPSTARQVVEERMMSRGALSIFKPPPDDSLWVSSRFQFWTSCSSVITPSAMTLSYNTSPTFFEVCLENPPRNFNMELRTSEGNRSVWTAVMWQGADYLRTSNHLTEPSDAHTGRSRNQNMASTIDLHRFQKDMNIATNTQEAAAFVDRYRAELIGRVYNVMPIADALLSKGLVHPQKYSEIRAAATSEAVMREIYECLRSAGAEGKAAFYGVLLQEEPHLLKDLSTHAL